MEGFTIVDGVVAAVILISAILAYSRGFIREAMAIAGWVVAAIVAYMFAPRTVPLLREIPVLRDFIAEGGDISVVSNSCELSIIAAFAILMALALLVLSVFTPLFSSAVQHSALGGLDQSLGFIFGVLRGILLVAIALVIYDRVAVSNSVPMVDNSRTALVFARSAERIDEYLPDNAPEWFKERYEALVSSCNAPGGTQQQPAATQPAENAPEAPAE
ncbi:MAG: colicin V production CvpA [Rhodobacterales bacterium]|nr:MAG: colicin V production CvpA [Rhodobacterales bacterium]